MWWSNRSLWYAGVISCAFHIILLGVAASVSVALPAAPVTPVRVTLLQRAVPLPVQELPKGGEEPQAVSTPPPAKMPPPKRVLPRPVAKKKPAPRAPPRPPKPIVKPKPDPLPEPPPVVKKESTQVALETRPSPEVPIPKEPEISAAEQIATKSDKMTGDAASTKDGTNEVLSLASKTGRSSQGGETEGAGGLSATPDYNVNPKPPYPLLARRIGAQGEVLLRVLVRPDGSVAAVELARSSGFSLLDESATRTVRDSWRFIPARLDGAPVESWVEVPIKFVLADS